MGSGSGTHDPTRSRRDMLRRRRVLAGTAVLACVAADVWSVSWTAGARESAPQSRVVTAATLGMTAGTAPAINIDPVERVPDDAASDSQVPSSTSKGGGDGAGGSGAAKVVQKGNGEFTVVPVPAATQRATRATGRPVRYTLEIEGGLGVAPSDLATKVTSVLLAPRGWQTRDRVRFVNVSPAQAAAGARVDLRITLSSPDTTDRLCAPLATRGQVSCHNGGRVVLNLRRWVLGAAAYGSNIDGYRTYLVNHEVGHGIGHAHAYCGGRGKPAPVMMQQTYGLKGCTAWPWPTSKPA